MTTSLLPQPVRQLGFVVENLDAGIAAWSARLGLGPWTVFRNIDLQCTFRGAPSRPLIDIALAYQGEMQIELIQQRNDASSPYLPFVKAGQFGLHHHAVLCERIDADVDRLQKAGMSLACDIRMPSGRYVYLDSPTPGDRTFLELIEATPTMLDMWRAGISASAAWDGKSAPTVIDFAQMPKGD